MGIAALVCLVLAILVLRAKGPGETPNTSRLYRIDNRVVAAVLFILALMFIVLAWFTGRALL
jgi:hypothetical protein